MEGGCFEADHGAQVDHVLGHAVVVDGDSAHDVDEAVVRSVELVQGLVVLGV